MFFFSFFIDVISFLGQKPKKKKQKNRFGHIVLNENENSM